LLLLLTEGNLPGAIAWGTPNLTQLAPFSERSYLMTAFPV